MHCNLLEITKKLKTSQDLSESQINLSIEELIDEKVEVDAKKSFLAELARKGESDREFHLFVKRFRSFSRDPQLEDFSSRAIDLCGTGGDRVGSFNVSTIVSIMLAAAEVPVIKHGNRSISSKCGSADLLEALGIPMETEPEVLKESLRQLNFCFLFAPHFHPAFKHLAATRKALAEEGTITIFNRLGPCLNPARPAYQLLGVYDPAYMKQMAHALQENGGRSGWVVHGLIAEENNQGVDELTSCGSNLIQPYGLSNNESVVLHPEDWGQEVYSKNDLSGGTIEENLGILKQLLQGKAKPGLQSTILVNAASALFLVGKAKTLEEGVEIAEKLLLEGHVLSWLEKAKGFFSK